MRIPQWSPRRGASRGSAPVEVSGTARDCLAECNRQDRSIARATDPSSPPAEGSPPGEKSGIAAENSTQSRVGGALYPQRKGGHLR